VAEYFLVHCNTNIFKGLYTQERERGESTKRKENTHNSDLRKQNLALLFEVGLFCAAGGGARIG
jgi:hypothetical protein